MTPGESAPMTPTLRTEIPADRPELSAGWVVLVLLARPVYGDMRCFVGEVQRSSPLGLRITTIDWLLGTFTGADFWFKWEHVVAVEVFTDQHELGHVDLGARQTRYNGRPAEGGAPPASSRDPWRDLPPPPGSAEAAARVAARTKRPQR